ncbi:hypothetical protein B0H16DRAFT_1894194 [Mycena metata]|uniref:Uncharacterized protein n=1 Tax=Mycena metata TaxID=1033252 RepID=A0AAD7HU27_9AGAR|nr:hypothetical protein B0H16DRAFT_1894194 [Mycena metata]
MSPPSALPANSQLRPALDFTKSQWIAVGVRLSVRPQAGQAAPPYLLFAPLLLLSMRQALPKDTSSLGVVTSPPSPKAHALRAILILRAAYPLAHRIFPAHLPPTLRARCFRVLAVPSTLLRYLVRPVAVLEVGCDAQIAEVTDSRLAVDVLVFLLTVMRGIMHQRSDGYHFSLLGCLVRDGAMYFFAISMANLVNILMFYFGDPVLAGRFSTSLSTTLIARFMLNLHAVADAPTEVNLRTDDWDCEEEAHAASEDESERRASDIERGRPHTRQSEHSAVREEHIASYRDETWGQEPV